MKVLDLFSGIGGFSLGLERAGMETIAFCENDSFCRRVLKKHWPEVPILGDITKETFEGVEANLVCGGFPCQDISWAGKRAGLSGERSGLYWELMRALRVVRPKHAIVENVAALLSDGMGTVLGDMAESGFDAEWDCVPARAVGAPHERDRVWIVAHAAREQVGVGRQPRIAHSLGAVNPNVEGKRRGPGRARRFPDSFAGVRVEARRHLADATSKGLEGRQPPEAARSARPKSARSYFWPWPRRWPDEPPLSGVDDGVPDWVDRVKTTGNAVLPQIPEIIGQTLMRASR